MKRTLLSLFLGVVLLPNVTFANGGHDSNNRTEPETEEPSELKPTFPIDEKIIVCSGGGNDGN